MDEICTRIVDNILIVERKRARQSEQDIKEIKIEELKLNKIQNLNIKIVNEEQKNKILLFEKANIDIFQNKDELYEKYDNNEECDEIIDNEKIDEEDDNNEIIDNEKIDEEDDNNEIIANDITKEMQNDEKYILVYTTLNKVKYAYITKNRAYKKMVSLKYKVLNVSINKKYLQLTILAYVLNKYNLKIENMSFFVGDVINKESNLKQYNKKLSKKEMLMSGNIYKFKFDLQDIIQDTTAINESIKFILKINDTDVEYNIGIRNKKIKKKKNYYIPMMGKYIDDYAIHIRRTMRGNLILVKRPKELIENEFKFRFLESKFVSFMLYKFGKIYTKFRRKKINLFFEKFSSKSEEGVFELCKKLQTNRNSKNYFIIDKNSEDYKKIKDNSFVIPKFTCKYYWLIYNANNFIATETQMHVNILRSNNKYLRKSIYEKKFIFLQHGIIFMKNLKKNSTFVKGREAEPDYMVVSSEYEKNVVEDMLSIKPEKLLKTGLALYSKLEHKHINKDSQDFITIMLTWKPYEEGLSDFEESSYYKYIIEIYEKLKRYITEDKIAILPHPKVFDFLSNTDLEKIIWKGKISDCLEKTKLLITDYSSVCYNSFYQGAGVIFYQPDLERYEIENGKLVPNDNEYIGYRAFSLQELDKLLQKTINNGKIDLNYIRNKEFEERYKTINEFSDGKNIDRIYQELERLNII